MVSGAFEVGGDIVDFGGFKPAEPTQTPKNQTLSYRVARAFMFVGLIRRIDFPNHQDVGPYVLNGGCQLRESILNPGPGYIRVHRSGRDPEECFPHVFLK